jgi:hypothetical protein
MITVSDGTGSGPPPSAPGRPRPRRRRTGRLVLVVVIVLVAAGIGTAFALNRGSDDGGKAGRGSTTTGSSGTNTATGSETVQAASSSFTVGPTRRDVLKDSGSITITKDGSTVSNVHVNGVITVAANNVTVQNFIAGGVVQKGKNLVLEDGRIDGVGAPGNSDGGIVYNNYTARHLEVTETFDGVKAFGNVTIENCWIHDLNAQSGNPADGAGGYTHNDGIQAGAGSHIVIKDNRIERPGNNSAVFIDSDQGKIDDVTIEGNFLDGGGYTLYVIQSRSAPQFGSPTNVTVEGNVFGKNWTQGPVTLAPGVTFTDNVDTSKKSVPRHVDNLSQ